MQPQDPFKIPVIMLETMSGRMTSFSIRMRISPGKPKYCLSRLDRLAYSRTAVPKQTPAGEHDQTNQKPRFFLEARMNPLNAPAE